MIITIDGRVATGKSTIARKVAESLGFIYFDTGAMYRAVTYAIMKDHIDYQNEEALKKYISTLQLNIKLFRGEKNYIVNGENVTEQIRTPEVTQKVSEISALQPLRDKLVAFQRELGNNVNAVFEGRDMGTVVFPKADLKIFLTGSPEIRAKRRYEDLLARYPHLKDKLSLEKVLEETNKRDEYDSARTNSPLRQADDAYVIDTSNMTPDEVMMAVLEFRDRIKLKKDNL